MSFSAHHRNIRSTQIESIMFRRILVCAAFALIACGQFSFAEIVYDNFGGPFEGAHPLHFSAFTAQPFRLGDQDTVDSVTLGIGGQGRPNGDVFIEIWDDNEGVPGESVGVAGVITPLDDMLLNGAGETFVFDSPVMGLEPNSEYHIVLYTDGTNWNLGNRVAWGASKVSGAENAEEGMSTLNTGEWHTIRHNPEIPGPPFAVYFRASIDATMSLVGDIDGDGVLTTDDVDLLSNAIVVNSSESQFDINNDGRVDGDDRVEWVHTLKNTYFGDANLDGEFNSGDLTEVFKAGEFEDSITLNSTWAEGDWNGDGDFDSGDLVTAFRDGGYETGPRAAAAAVPEPSSWALLTLGFIGVGRVQRER